MRRTISHDWRVRIALNVVCLWSGASRGHGPLCLYLYLCLLSEIVYPLNETCDGCGGEKGVSLHYNKTATSEAGAKQII